MMGASPLLFVTTFVLQRYGFADTEAARGVELLASVAEVVPDPEPRVRFIEMGDSALIFRVLCWVDEPVLRGRCIDGLNTAVYKRLVAAGINIPFPQREIQIRRAPRSDAAQSA